MTQPAPSRTKDKIFGNQSCKVFMTYTLNSACKFKQNPLQAGCNIRKRYPKQEYPKDENRISRLQTVMSSPLIRERFQAFAPDCTGKKKVAANVNCNLLFFNVAPLGLEPRTK